MNTPGKVFSWLVSLYSFVVLGILLFLSYTEGKRYQMGIIASFLMLLIVFPPLWSFLDREYNVRIYWLIKLLLWICCYGFLMANINAVG
jgi:hypothetical protein